MDNKSFKQQHYVFALNDDVPLKRLLYSVSHKGCIIQQHFTDAAPGTLPASQQMTLVPWRAEERERERPRCPAALNH